MVHIDNPEDFMSMTQDEIYNYLKDRKNDFTVIQRVINWNSERLTPFISKDLYIRLIRDKILDLYKIYKGYTEEYGNLFEYSLLEKRIDLADACIQSGIDIEKCLRKKSMMDDIFRPVISDYFFQDEEEIFENEMKNIEKLVDLLKRYNFLEKIPKYLYDIGDFIEYCQESSEGLDELIETCEIVSSIPSGVQEKLERLWNEQQN